MKWDVFISHASEDKESFVKKLSNTLNLVGVKVWYDEFTLKVGDSLSKSLDNGLINSQFGIVVISPSFIAKGWTDYELRSLINREVGYKKVILPIWHNISKEKVQKFSPFLADKFALNTSTYSIKELVIKLIEVIRPDIFENFHRHLLYEKIIREGEIRESKPDEVFDSLVRHESLPTPWINRIEIIHRTFGKFYEPTLEQTIENFKKDLNPDREIKIWESIVSSYLEIINEYNIQEFENQKEIYKILLGYSMGVVPKETRLASDNALFQIMEIYKKHFPLTKT